VITFRLLKIKHGHREGVQKMNDCGWHGALHSSAHGPLSKSLQPSVLQVPLCKIIVTIAFVRLFERY